MLDIKKLNEEVLNNLKKRGYVLPEKFNECLTRTKRVKIEIEEINAKINQNKHTLDDKVILKQKKAEYDIYQKELNEIIYMIPNVLHETVPPGNDENYNVLIKEVYNENRLFDGKHHVDLGKPLGLDIAQGVELAQARFNLMRGDVAKLHRKLLNKALDFYTTLGYEEFYVPNLVHQKAMFGTGQYPKFKDEFFCTNDENQLCLIPTGEVPLTNVFANKILDAKDVENKLMTHTPCFRKEVGAGGKDTRGILRQHQFEKVELVRTCLPENGLKNFKEMIQNIDAFVKDLGIPYRIIELCAGDIGFAGHKAYDFEIWFPGENKYREIATVTWCHEFQARRMNFKYKQNGKKDYAHTLNGTGLAVGRVLAAIIEHEKVHDFLKQ